MKQQLQFIWWRIESLQWPNKCLISEVCYKKGNCLCMYAWNSATNTINPLNWKKQTNKQTKSNDSCPPHHEVWLLSKSLSIHAATNIESIFGDHWLVKRTFSKMSTLVFYRGSYIIARLLPPCSISYDILLLVW